MSATVLPGRNPGPPPRPARFNALRAIAARLSRWLHGTTYTRKWLFLGILLGAIAGGGAVVFYEALEFCTHIFLGVLAGYRIPTPFGEGNYTGTAPPARAWALPLIVGGGALLGAIPVFRFAPEAEGHGTDAAISAVHNNPRGVRLRTVLVKIVASALTIGSGGSGGREGPTGQISAGFGSLLARVLDLRPEDARIAVATGIGAGIGSIFGAPLGGAVLAAEILYRDDFEPAALLPCFIASGVGYGIFGAVEGFTPLFGYADHHFSDPAHLIWFAVIGIAGGLIGLLYAKGFYGINSLFARSPLPRWANPAIGGLLVGASAIAIPEVLGTGYGWIQHGLGPQLGNMPLWIVLILPFARILATGLSIGSGGAGGIFGPGMVIGAFVGAAVWRLFDPIFPWMGHDPAPYVVVGMMCCFGSVARAPLAVTIMVAEMTGSLTAVEPGMIAVGLAWLIVHRTDVTIYRSQLKTRAESAGHGLVTGLPLMATVPVTSALASPKLVLREPLSASEAHEQMLAAKVTAAPVVDANGLFEGTTTIHATADETSSRPLREVVDAGAPAIPSTTHLDAAIDALAAGDATFLPVLDHQRQVIGTLAISDVARAYRVQLLSHLTGSGDAEDPATTHIDVSSGDRLAGRPLREAGLPAGALVTTIERDGDLLTPAGDTVIKPGDHLTVVRPGRVPQSSAAAAEGDRSGS